MPKTRKNKDRKEQLNKFKELNKEKRMEVPKFKPFRQVPSWEPDAEIPITGREYSLLQDFFSVFAEPVSIMQDVFRRSLDKGVITIKYIDNDGKEVSKEEVEAYMKEMTEYLKNQAKATSKDAIVLTPNQEEATEEVVQPEIEEKPKEKKLKKSADLKAV